MKLLNYVYNNQAIDFDPAESNEVMVNATQMAKAFGKRVKDFLKTEQTQNFLKELEVEFGNGNIYNKNDFQGEYLPLEASENILKIVHGGRNNGTWMHRLLALKLAA